MALDLNDKTSNGNNLTNNNGITEVTSSLPFAQSTSAADLESTSSQFFSASDSASLSITSDLTLEGWFKFETLANNGVYTLLSKWAGDVANGLSYIIYVLVDGSGNKTINFNVSDDGTNGGTTATWSVSLSTATWYHLAVTYNAAGGSSILYLDTTAQATKTGMDTSIYNSTVDFRIGANEVTETNFFDGVVDDVRVWNDIRTATEIANNYNVELAGNEANLVAYWPFEASLGGTALTQNLSDTITLSDSLSSKAVGKSFSDSITLSDALVNAVGKILADTVTLSDAIVNGVGKVLSDTITLSDSLTQKTIGKVLEDTIALTDSIVKAFSKTLSDTVTLTDSIVRGMVKLLSDTITLSDRLPRGLWLLKGMTSSIWTLITHPSSIWTRQTPTSTTWTEQESS